MTVRIASEPFTYRRDSPNSYFADLLYEERLAGARDRLRRHAKEMAGLSTAEDKAARRRLDDAGIEYRVEPNRTDGTGGYFAPPAWLVEFFSTAKRPGRVLADLIPNAFALPDGASSVNLPVLAAGTTVQSAVDDAAVPSSDITDAAGTSTVVTLAGQADVPLQMVEQSPTGASFDWAMMSDLTEALDFDLETQLLYGSGSTYSQLTGITNVSAITAVSYTDNSPTGSKMWPYLTQGAAQLADLRRLPPEVILLRHSRWQWLAGAEDTSGRPFGLPTWYFGVGPNTPDPIGAINGLPAYGDEAISATLGTGANQDQVLIARPSDLILFEAPPVANVFREVLSGSMGARIQLHQRVAAVTNRFSGAGIGTVGGSGFVVQSGF